MLLGAAMNFNVIAFSRGVAPVTTLDPDYNPGAIHTAPRPLTPRQGPSIEKGKRKSGSSTSTGTSQRN